MKKIGVEIENAIKDNEILEDEYDALLNNLRKVDKKRKDEIKKSLEQARSDSKISDKDILDGYAGRGKYDAFTGRNKTTISSPNLKKMHLSESLFMEGTEDDEDFETGNDILGLDPSGDEIEKEPLEIEDDEVAETPLDEEEYRVGDYIRIIHVEDEPHYDGREGRIDDIDVDDEGNQRLHGTWGGIAISTNYGDEIERIKDDISEENPEDEEIEDEYVEGPEEEVEEIE